MKFNNLPQTIAFNKLNSLFIVASSAFFSITASAKNHTGCLPAKNAQQAAENFMKEEMDGARLSSNNLSKLDECFQTDNTSAWDILTLVHNYTLEPCANKSETCVRITYRPVATVTSDMKVQQISPTASKAKSFDINIKKEQNIWAIEGIEATPPLIHPTALEKFLQESATNSTNPQKIQEAIKVIKAL